MALQRAISAIEEDHEGYIMQLPDADIKQLISKTDEDGRWDITLQRPSYPTQYRQHADILQFAGQVAPACCCLQRKDGPRAVSALQRGLTQHVR